MYIVLFIDVNFLRGIFNLIHKIRMKIGTIRFRFMYLSTGDSKEKGTKKLKLKSSLFLLYYFCFRIESILIFF